MFAFDGGERNRVCLGDGSGGFTCSDVSTDTNDTLAVAVGDVDGTATLTRCSLRASGSGIGCVWATGQEVSLAAM